MQSRNVPTQNILNILNIPTQNIQNILQFSRAYSEVSVDRIPAIVPDFPAFKPPEIIFPRIYNEPVMSFLKDDKRNSNPISLTYHHLRVKYSNFV